MAVELNFALACIGIHELSNRATRLTGVNKAFVFYWLVKITCFSSHFSLYLKAQMIAPKNGRPYNQLAILALYTRRKLDAVYYYMRSLAASNPFITARESLMTLFDDARKRREAGEHKKLQVRYMAGHSRYSPMLRLAI